MDPRVRREVEHALGETIASVAPLSGGDINEAWEARTSSGSRVFVKTNARAPADMFEAEAHGLDWLRRSGALRIPTVLAVGAQPPFLVLEHLGSGRPRSGFDEALGRGLAELHRTGAAGFGLERDNFIGRLPQTNATRASWSVFYRETRLAPMVERATRAGHLSSSVARDFDRLYATRDDLVGSDEPPSRLHGDLWGGNLHVDDEGAPCLIDPAVYGGHREIDLAMMKLFGGFGSRVFEAYDEAWPLPPGAGERVGLYQLYPLLVHVNLFGGSYAASVRRELGRYV
jgi:protein-ribulosamine 3-kinase